MEDEQAEDSTIVNALTAVVRSADDEFQRVGGSSRHWVRDCFLPLLNRAGWRVQRWKTTPTPQPLPTQNEQGDWVCEHGTAMDVHCCNCHSGFLFDVDACVCEFAGHGETPHA